MVVDDGYLGGAPGGPAKDNPPLIVDPDRMEAGSFTAQRYQPVTRGNREVGKASRPVHLDQLAEGDTCDCGKPTILLLVKKFLGVCVGKRLDHGAWVGASGDFARWRKRVRSS